MDIVKRDIASVCRDAQMTTSMSFSMRTRVYEMAQASASATRKVIVIFGCGRLQEEADEVLELFYIAIDPEIEPSRFGRNMRSVRVLPYDVISISRRPGTVLYCKSTSEDFFVRANGDPGRFLVQHLVPHQAHQHARARGRELLRLRVCPRRYGRQPGPQPAP
ncbi:hypothetical protein VTO42DRAFT_8715 [Malbranchea cinnamomea]